MCLRGFTCVLVNIGNKPNIFFVSECGTWSSTFIFSQVENYFRAHLSITFDSFEFILDSLMYDR